jgi:hypothetical protein
MANIPATPLSNIQLELLKLYATGVSDDTLLELKELMSQFLMQKLREEAGKVWIEKGYTETDLSNWLNNGLE